MSESSHPEDRQGPAGERNTVGPNSEVISNHGELTPFGAALEPALHQACENRLGELHWFRTDWQRGGALTGYSEYQDDDGNRQPVVVKYPVPPVERKWLVKLSGYADVVPCVYAHGDTLNGYDIAWVVMERLEHGPLGGAWGVAAFDLLVEAAGRFYKAMADFEVEGKPVVKDWQKIYEQARKSVRDNDLPENDRWKKALKAAHKKLDSWVEFWRGRPLDHWCHGDLHLRNSMTRLPAPNGPAILFDLARVHRGHWVEDAVYFEHLYWAVKDQLEGRKIAKLIAQERRKAGLHVDDNWADYAQIKRGLLAMSVPAMLGAEGNPRHLAAALTVLENEV